MAFVKTKSYYENRIHNVERAISGTIQSIVEAKAAGDRRAEEAHGQYLVTIRKILAKERVSLKNLNNRHSRQNQGE